MHSGLYLLEPVLLGGNVDQVVRKDKQTLSLAKNVCYSCYKQKTARTSIRPRTPSIWNYLLKKKVLKLSY